MTNEQINDIAAASAAVARLPETRAVELSDGRRVNVHRLSWLDFEAVWTDWAGLLSALLAAGDDADEQELLGRLAGAPQAVLRLAAQCTRMTDAELARWPLADVLAVAAAALRLNFIDSAGVRDFFGALGGLAGAGLEPSGT